MIPTASGSQPTGTGGRKAEIPAATKRQIAKQAGEAAPLLERVVSSEAYGAPAQFQAPAETQPPPQPKPQQQQPQKQQPQKPVPKPRPTVTHETAPKPPRVLPPAELPAAPSPVSALTGTAGVEGVVFVGALALALGAGLLPRLRRQTN